MNKRNISFDILRIIAALSVILMHITVNDLYSLPMDSGAWVGTAVVNAVSHFGVPVFVMISGALFLDPARETDIKRLWTHNILRMVIVLVVWSVFYGVTDYLEYKAEPVYIVREIVDGRQHLWFIPMLVGLYMITPILHRWIKNARESEVKYFLILFMLIGVLWETLKAFRISGVIEHLDKFRNVELVCSYVGYFVLGYYVVHVGLSDKLRRVIYVAGIAGCILSAVTLIFVSRAKGEPVTELVDSFSLFTFTYALAVFTFVTELMKNRTCPAKLAGFLTELGKDTFGIYLVHLFLIERVAFLRIVYESLAVVPGAILYAIMLFVTGAVLSAALRRVPVVGRYIC